MGVSRICKWGVRNLMVRIFMGRNMKCSRSDSRHMLGLLRVTLCSEPNIFFID